MDLKKDLHDMVHPTAVAPAGMEDPPRAVMEAKFFARHLDNAYSTPAYRNGWAACIRMLRRRWALSDRQVEAVIRSKFTRWAADQSPNKYGQCTARDLERFIGAQGTHEKIMATIKQLEAETWDTKIV